MKQKIKRIAKYTMEDIAEIYLYIFCFYILSIMLSLFFESWRMFFYWPAFHVVIIVLGILSVYSERGKEVKLKVYQVIKFIKPESYKIIKFIKRKVHKAESSSSYKAKGEGWRAEGVLNGVMDGLKKIFTKSRNDLIKARMSVNSLKVYGDTFLRVVYNLAGKIKAIAILFFLIAKQVLEILIGFAVLKIKKLKKTEYIKIGIIIIVLGYAVNNKINIINFSILAYALISVLFIVESRIAAGLALMLLVSIPFLLIVKKNEMAEQVAIYAYYFLVITVLTQIREYKKEGGE